MDKIIKNSILKGIAGNILLLIFYFGFLTIINSFSHALKQFYNLWYWLLLLTFGFGIQLSLYSYVRQKILERKENGIKGKITTSGGISTVSMITCCAHHLVGILPILGLSTVFLLLAQYQIFFIILGILTNIFGIVLMLEIIKKNSLYKERGVLDRFSQLNIKILKRWIIGGSLIVLFISFFLIKNNPNEKSVANASSSIKKTEIDSSPKTIFLPPLTNNDGGLAIEVTPINFSFTQPVFAIALNTHQGSLDFDLISQAILLDDQGNQYLPLNWAGGQGGHHLSGTLTFPPLAKTTKKIKLIINDVYDISERIFEWNLE